MSTAAMSPPSATAIAVELTWSEYAAAASVGLLRMTNALGNRRDSKEHSWGRSWLEGTADHILGSAGELAYAKARGIYCPFRVGTFKQLGDVGAAEVRTARRLDADLIIRPDDPPERFYVLVTGEPPLLWLCGWVLAADGRRDEWLRDRGGYGAPAWWVPQSALHPFRPKGEA